jgi:hypothetical protein
MDSCTTQTTQNDLRLSTTPCVALEIFADYEDKRHVDEALGCELQGDDLDGRQYRMVRINGLTSSWARSQNVTSGATTIYVPGGAFIDDHTSELVIPSAARVKVRTCTDMYGWHIMVLSRNGLTP